MTLIVVRRDNLALSTAEVQVEVTGRRLEERMIPVDWDADIGNGISLREWLDNLAAREAQAKAAQA